MRTHRSLSIVLVCAFALVLAGPARAQITQAGGGAQAFFGSQGTGYTDSDPAFGPFTPAGAPGIGGYPAGAPLPNLPAPPTPTPITYPGSFGQPFQGGVAVSMFSDAPFTPTTTGTSKFTDIVIPTGPNVWDASVIGAFNLTQSAGAPGYAYEQLNVTSDYLVFNSLAGGTPALPLWVWGTVNPGGTAFAQFDAQITYTWTDINTAGVVGLTTNLGTLSYSFLQAGGGTFSQMLTSTGALASTPTTSGILEISGYLWLAGDPFSLNVEMFPEPASLGLLSLAALGLMRRRR